MFLFAGRGNRDASAGTTAGGRSDAKAVVVITLSVLLYGTEYEYRTIPYISFIDLVVSGIAE